MLFFIIFIGLFLRLMFINKPEGLWNDEYVSWYVSATPFQEGFFSEVLKQCHMPLYYLYLKPFAGCSDLILRLTSVLPGVLAILVMYLIGKEYSKKCGIYAASMTSVLSFLIYYSQEVRFYSLLFLFSALSLLFTIKLLKNFTRKNLAGYIISALLILFTHVLGGIYVGLNLAYVIYKKKKVSAKFFMIFALTLILIIPFGINILRMLPSSQWWGHFSYTNILFLFSDFFSPILTNNVNAPPVFFYNKHLALWILLPTLIALSGFCAGVKRFKGFSIITLILIIVMSILAVSGKLVFITKYSIEILPILILIVSFGFYNLKRTGSILFALFVAFHLAAIFTPNYVAKIPRSEGHRLVGEVLKYRNPDNILFTYYEPNRFERYVDLTNKNALYISKANRFEYKDNPEKILDTIKSSETVSVVFLDSVSFFDENFVSQNLNNPNIPEMFMTFSTIKNSLIRTLNDNYSDFTVDKNGAWLIITGKKI